MIEPSRYGPQIADAKLADKLEEVRNRAETHGQVFTNFPRERFADAHSGDRSVSSLSIPNLRRDASELVKLVDKSPLSKSYSGSSPMYNALSVAALYYSPKCKLANDVKLSLMPKNVYHQKLPQFLSQFDESFSTCSKCCQKDTIQALQISDISNAILSHACGQCGVSLSEALADSPMYHFLPIGTECSSCGWTTCLQCVVGNGIADKVKAECSTVRAEIESRYDSKLALLRMENHSLQQRLETQPFASPTDMRTDSSAVSTDPLMSVAYTPSISPSPQDELLNSFKSRIIELESQLSCERNSRDHFSSLLSSLQREHIQYKTDCELNMESSAAEHILLQSRMVEQSVQLADARARIDELTSVQRRTPSLEDQLVSSSSGISQREALLINENNHLKEEIDFLKQSLHAEFDNWKKTIIKQVKNECVKYRDKVKEKLISEKDAAKFTKTDEDNSLFNQRELDYLFEEVDWTSDMDVLNASKSSFSSKEHYKI